MGCDAGGGQSEAGAETRREVSGNSTCNVLIPMTAKFGNFRA